MRISQSTKNAVLVRALRNAFNLSQSDLAQVASTSRPTVNRIESLDQNARLDTIESLLEVFRSIRGRVDTSISKQRVETCRGRNQEGAKKYLKLVT